MLGQRQRIVVTAIASLLLIACSSDNSGSSATKGKQPSETWSYQETWDQPDFPEEIASLVGGKVTIKGQCYFSKGLLLSDLTQKRTIVMPFLTVASDGSLAPAFKQSLTVYKALGRYFHLAPPLESVQLYQRWVSSLEHACPKGLSRNIAHCSLRNIYSMVGGSPSLYDFERLNHWLTKNADNSFILMPNFSLLNSKAALSLKYSANSLPIVKKTVSEQVAMATPYLGKQSISWVALNDQNQLDSELVSAGYCSVAWREFEQLRSINNLNDLTIESLNDIHQALTPTLIELISGALERMTLLKH